MTSKTPINMNNFEFASKYGSEKLAHKTFEDGWHSPSLLMQRPGGISDELFDKVYEKSFETYDYGHIDLSEQSEKLKPNQIEKLLTKSKFPGDVHRNIARNAKLEDTHANYLMLSNIDEVKENLIKNPNLHPKHIDKMLKDNNRLIRHAVMNPKLPREHALNELFPNNPAHSNIDYQREIVYKNDNLNEDDLKRVAQNNASDIVQKEYAENRLTLGRFTK